MFGKADVENVIQKNGEACDSLLEGWMMDGLRGAGSKYLGAMLGGNETL